MECFQFAQNIIVSVMNAICATQHDSSLIFEANKIDASAVEGFGSLVGDDSSVKVLPVLQITFKGST